MIEARNTSSVGAFERGHPRGLWRIAVPLPALLIGIAAMRTHGVPTALWLTNLLIALLGTIAFLIVCFRGTTSPWRSKTPKVLFLVAIVALGATFYGKGLENVHRWINIGPFRLYIGSIVLPLMLLALPAIEQSFLRWGLAVAITGLLALQPDASQATAFAIAVGALLWDRRPASLLGSLLLAFLALIAWTRPDPLKPVPHVEGILSLAFSLSPILALLGVASLAALPLPFLALTKVHGRVCRTGLALAVYFGVVLCTCATNRFPVPLMGYGASPIVGYYTALSYLMSVRERCGPNQIAPENKGEALKLRRAASWSTDDH